MIRSTTWPALFALLISLIASQTASAQRYTTTLKGKEVIVHTNPLPVAIHRMLPPNRGKHVSAREIQSPRRR